MDVLVFADFTRLYSIAGVTVLDVATVASYGYGNASSGADLSPDGRTLLITDRSTCSVTDANTRLGAIAADCTA